MTPPGGAPGATDWRGALKWSRQSCVPRRQSWRRMACELPHSPGLCGSAAVTAGMASLAACSTAGGALRWSTQSCVPRLQVERAVLRATPPVLAAVGFRTTGQPGCVLLCPRARPHGKPGGLLHLAGGPLRWSTQSCVPRRQSWRRMACELPHSSGLCRSAAVTARTASLAACSTAGGALRWSTQSCVPRRQSWRRLAFRTPAQPGIVWLCRRDRRHGKPGGMLHCGRCLEVEHAVLRATPPVLAAVGVPNYRTARVHVALPP